MARPGDAGQLGYTIDGTEVERFAIDLREKWQTQWAYIAFFTRYPITWGAYQGGAKVVMGLGDTVGDSMDHVFAHETGHIFGAPDEYAGSFCKCTSIRGRFFHERNGNCARCAPFSLDTGFPEAIAGNWPGLPAAFQSDLDATLVDKKGQVFLFKGAEYVRFTNIGSRVDTGYPKASPTAGPVCPLASITASTPRCFGTTGRIYLFSGSLYARFVASETPVEEDYPKVIAENWPGLPFFLPERHRRRSHERQRQDLLLQGERVRPLHRRQRRHGRELPRLDRRELGRAGRLHQQSRRGRVDRFSRFNVFKGSQTSASHTASLA